MIRFALAATVLALSACAPTIPDSGAGVGFNNYSDYNSYRATREAELRGTSLPAPEPVATASRDGDGPITSSTLNSAGIGSPPVEYAAPPSGRVVAVPVNDPSISDEQDFGAVSDRVSIEGDKERLRAQREAFEVIQPKAVPTRNGTAGPNIVQYALSNSNPVGRKLYSRSILKTQAKADRACARYNSPDLAQEEFLRSGGPDRDRLGLDPDGDGFACSWDPTAFRKIAPSNG